MGSNYTAVTTYGDFGPWVSKLIVELPDVVSSVDAASFSVYCERLNTADGSIATVVERPSMRTHASRGYVSVVAAAVCDEDGNHVSTGNHIALNLPECEFTNRINVASVTAAEYVDCHYVATQIKGLDGASGPVCGVVADRCVEVTSPSLSGWSHGRGGAGEYEFGYACFDPKTDEAGEKSQALIVWLHGASDGGEDVRLPYTASHVTLLGEPRIQKSFGGGAWVLVPQCPTFWMDDGVEQMGRSNISIYTASLKALIDEFVAAHPSIDPDRVVVGGLSNGGFMALRLIIDYPDAFSACVASCAPLFVENQSPEVIEAMAKTPVWFAHSKDDFIVDAKTTVLPLIHKLEAVGAEAHLSYYDHIEDETGLYKDANGNPRRNFGHGVWIHVFNDFCHTELDGTNVMCDGEPVRIWEWAGRMSR